MLALFLKLPAFNSSRIIKLKSALQMLYISWLEKRGESAAVWRKKRNGATVWRRDAKATLGLERGAMVTPSDERGAKVTFEEAAQQALAFRHERDWEQFHNPKDLAISLNLEAAELLETFQWSGADLQAAGNKEHMAEELADVLIYCIYFAESAGIDIPQAISDKLARNAQKYPVDKAKGNSKKYKEL